MAIGTCPPREALSSNFTKQKTNQKRYSSFRIDSLLKIF
jgi:hypothetical protein